MLGPTLSGSSTSQTAMAFPPTTVNCAVVPVVAVATNAPSPAAPVLIRRAVAPLPAVPLLTSTYTLNPLGMLLITAM